MTILGRLYGHCGEKNKPNRDDWLKTQLTAIPAGGKILDAGAGERSNKRFCKHLQYLSQDFGQYDGSGNEMGLQAGKWDYSGIDIVSDIASIPVLNESFDVVLCSEVFEHLPNPIAAIKELARITRGGGILLLTAPVCSLTHHAPFYFYNGFSRYFYEKFLNEAGFQIEELSFNGHWFEYVAQELLRLPFMVERYTSMHCGKVGILIMRICLAPLLTFLNLCSHRNIGSAELLSCGIHIRAVKI